MLLLVALHASAYDGDTDGYHRPPYPPPVDCNDDLASVSPKAPEVVGNVHDEDCDGADALKRSAIID